MRRASQLPHPVAENPAADSDQFRVRDHRVPVPLPRHALRQRSQGSPGIRPEVLRQQAARDLLGQLSRMLRAPRAGDVMNVLVTGGAGYVGSTLVPLLLGHDHHVRVLDALLYGGQSLLGVWEHPEFEFGKGDIRDGTTLREALTGVDAVVHLAAIVGDPACARAPEAARAGNLDASLALLEECRRAKVARFVFASTCSNYGRMKDPTCYVDERSELAPVSVYAETKVAVERVLLDPRQTGGITATPLRFATVFGVSPRMRLDLTVNEFTAEMLTKARLQVYGEQFWRPYIHVRDAARAIAGALAAPTAVVGNQV